MSDLIGGRVDVMFVGMPTARQNASCKDLLMLAVTGDKRRPELPEVPTFSELGIKAWEAETAIWWGIADPAGMAADVTAKLDAAVSPALKDPPVLSALTTQGVDVLSQDAKAVRMDRARHRETGKTDQGQKIGNRRVSQGGDPNFLILVCSSTRLP